MKICAIAALGFMAAMLPAWSAHAEVSAGGRLDRDTWQSAAGMLPGEILEHFKRGEMAAPIAEIPAGAYRLDPDVVEAGERNIGRFAIDARGSVVDRATGKVPEGNFGLPFASIDPASPTAASEVFWNLVYAFYAEGTMRLCATLKWLGPHSRSPEREVTIDIRSVAVEGNRLRQANPLGITTMARNYVLRPADVEGTQTLSWRFKDPTKQDNNWAYVPAMRRIRQVTPTNRADGFLGSDMSQDDGFNGFDVKPEDFVFRLIGEGHDYQPFNQRALEGLPTEMDPSGQGYRFPATSERYGLDEAGWSGVPWQPLDVVFVKRPVWRVEAAPRDPYYPYRRIVFSVDKETYRASIVSKFDAHGANVNTFVRMIAFARTPDGHYSTNVPTGGQWAENLKLNRATTATLAEDWPYTYQNEPEPFEDYTGDAIIRRGK